MLGRDQYRQVYRSKDRPHTLPEVLGGEKRKAKLILELIHKSGIEAEMRTSKNSWYKVTEGSAITIVNDSNPKELGPLSEYSPIASLNAGNQYFIYVKKEDVSRAKQLIADAIPDIEKTLRSESEAAESGDARPAASAKKPASTDNEAAKQRPITLPKDVSVS